MLLIRWIFDPFANVGDDAEKTSYVIICRKMGIVQVVMHKCRSRDEFVTHLPMSAMMPERPQIPSFAV